MNFEIPKTIEPNSNIFLENVNKFFLGNMSESISENVVIERKPTVCFITMCKNEQHCIQNTLESVYKYIDSWVVCDTGSTDRTCEIVTEFFKEKNIPGELFINEWRSFHENKSIMFEKGYNKSDLLLHFDADDILNGELNLDILKNENADIYMFNCKRGSFDFPCSLLYNNRLRWKYCGVAHNTIKCLDKEHTKTSICFTKQDLWLDCNERGSRAFDPKKYHKDAELLKTQFFDTLYNDPDGLNNRSCFYAAQSYMDSNQNEEALKWYCLYLKLKNTWQEEVYESYLKISEILIRLKRPFHEIEKQINRSIEIFPDRAEGFFILANYCNHIKMQEKAYELFKQALSKNFNEIKTKYTLFIRPKNYGKYIYDELSVACYWTGRYDEGLKYLEIILVDPEFEQHKERFNDNLKHFKGILYSVLPP